jgi:hypothetical protein
MAITGSMTALILKRANFSRPSGQWQDEDYDVLTDAEARPNPSRSVEALKLCRA